MKKKYPFIKQDGLKDCGVSSLLMIIKYYHGNISKERLRELTKTNKNGTTAYNLIEAARMLGFRANGIKCKLEEIENTNLPCIAYVTINDIYKHYIVIYKINFEKKELLIADPADKIKKISFSEFEKIYNEILITPSPKKKIPVFEKEESFFKYIKNILKKHKNKLIIITILSFIITFISILSSFYFSFILNKIGQNQLIFSIFLVFLLLEVFKNINLFLRNQILIYINQKINFEVFMDVLKKIVLLPYNYYRNRTSGEIVMRINDLNIVIQTINEIILTVFVDIILIIFSGIILFLLNKFLFIYTIIFLLLYIIVILSFKPQIYKNFDKVKTNYSLVNSYVVESLTGFETVKGLGIQKNVISNLKDKFNLYIKNMKNLEFINNLEQTITNLIMGIGNVIIIYIGICFINTKQISMGTLLTFIFLLNYFLNSVKNILNLVKNTEESKIAYKRIIDIINYEVKKKKDKNIVFKQLELRKSTNMYDNLFSKSDFKIELGEKIVIIGKTGSGKSTLLKQLKNYYDTNNVFANEKKIQTFSTNDINKNICYVSQNEFLFSDTLYNNIVLGRKIEQNKFFKVIEECYIDEIIKDSSYYMMIEENGFNISGGEKQRIVLARSLLSEANFLFIDEGLSQIDTDLERKILKNIINDYKNKTIIFVTHRVDNIDLFDRVVKIDNKEILEDVTRNN